jgi:hypothetical protein
LFLIFRIIYLNISILYKCEKLKEVKLKEEIENITI